MVISVPSSADGGRGALHDDDDDNSVRLVPLVKNALPTVNGKGGSLGSPSSEDDVTTKSELLGGVHDATHKQKMSFALIFRRGGLGDFLYHSFWGYHLYVFGLVFILGGCETGLVALNRFLFMTGAWRFPYPVSTTFAQLLATHVFLELSARLTRVLTKPLLYLGLTGLIAPMDSSTARSSTGINEGGSFVPQLRSSLRYWPLALLFSFKVLLSNLSFAYTVLPKYTFARLHTVPATLILVRGIFGTSHSMSTLSSSMAAVVYLGIGSNQPGPSGAWDSNLAGIVSGICVSLYPILFLKTYNNLTTRDTSQGNGSITRSANIQTDNDPNDASYQRSISAATHWHLLRRLSFLSVLFLAPILLVSGEILDIYRNCYILDQYKLWTPLVGSFLTSFGVFVVTPLLVRATSPLTATFVMVPRSAYQLAILHADMPSANWVGIIACYLSSIWYLLVRRSESVGLKALRS